MSLAGAKPIYYHLHWPVANGPMGWLFLQINELTLTMDQALDIRHGVNKLIWTGSTVKTGQYLKVHTEDIGWIYRSILKTGLNLKAQNENWVGSKGPY